MIRKDFYNSLQIALKGKADIDNPRGSDYMVLYKLGHTNDFDNCVTVTIKRDVVTIETITGGLTDWSNTVNWNHTYKTNMVAVTADTILGQLKKLN